MRRYSPNHPAVIAHRKTHPPRKMAHTRQATIIALIAVSIITASVWYVSITSTLTAWWLIRKHYK
jgi:hypothetical protein